jgi:hypothetical protein
MALLTAGWPLLDSAVPNRQPLAAGAKVTVGSGPGSSGTVTVGPGWYVQPALSIPTQNFVLTKDGVVLDIRHVALVDSFQMAFAWLGMRQVLSLTHPGTELSEPAHTTTGHGRHALIGTISGPGLIGMAAVVPGPSREFAIAMVMLAPHGTSRALIEAARRILLSLTFTAPSR